MKFVIDILKKVAEDAELTALKWDKKTAIFMKSQNETIAHKAHSASEERWRRVNEIWQAIRILEGTNQ